MPAECPGCHSSRTKVWDTRLLANGSRWRRHVCHDCNYRWTTWVGKRPRRGRSSGAKHNRYRGPLSLEEVRLILTSPLSAGQLARELGCSKQAVCAVRRGLSHVNDWPKLPRQAAQTGPSCLDCNRWESGSCELGVPDPILEGPGVARDCSLFERRLRRVVTDPWRAGVAS